MDAKNQNLETQESQCPGEDRQLVLAQSSPVIPQPFSSISLSRSSILPSYFAAPPTKISAPQTHQLPRSKCLPKSLFYRAFLSPPLSPLLNYSSSSPVRPQILFSKLPSPSAPVHLPLLKSLIILQLSSPSLRASLPALNFPNSQSSCAQLPPPPSATEAHPEL